MATISDALFTKTQQKVLGLLFSNPEKSFYTNDIFRRTAIGRGTVVRELEKLSSSGLLTVTSSGNQRHYQANSRSPVYAELIGLVRKTLGIPVQIQTALTSLENDIELAFIYGSLPKGSETTESDVDLMLVGNKLSYSDIMELLLPLEKEVGRPINPTIYSLKDFHSKLQTGNHFLQRVLEQPKWMIKGEEDDWFYPDLTDTSLRVIIHSEVKYAKKKKIQSRIQTRSRSACQTV